MTFADALALRVKRGEPLQAAIAAAAKETGAGEVTVKHIQAARDQHPEAFPPNYKRLR